ncbi:MAG: right-handed parallel beta-helix repeat-containing protein [Deltaproteobacteria bacterium]
MRRALPWLLVASCSSADAIVVQIDAHPAVLTDLAALEVEIGGGDGAPSRFDFAVGEEVPDCLPVLFGVERDAADRLILDVTGNPGGEASFTQHIEAPFSPGLRQLDVVLDAACVSGACPNITRTELPETTADAIDARARSRVCQTIPTESECAERGGCYDEEREVCNLPCGDPNLPDPPDEPALPSAPNPVVLAPCPTGWVMERAACVPWAADTAACPRSTYRFLGDSTCEAVGTCEATWPSDAPRDAIYVQPGATGNGTQTSPYGTLEAALARAAPGATIVLSSGAHRIPPRLAIDEDVNLLGACVATTSLSGGDLAPSNVDLRVERFEVARIVASGGVVTVHEAEVSELETTRGAAALTSAVVDDARFTGSNVTVERARLRRMELLDTTFDATDLEVSSGGVLVDEDSTATIDRALVEGRGVDVDGELVATDFVVREVIDEAFSGGGEIDLSRTLVRDVHGEGFGLSNGALTATDLLVQNVRATSSYDGRAVDVSGVDLVFDRVRIEEAGAYAVRLSGGTANITDIVVDTTVGDLDRTRGIGMRAITSSVTMLRAAFSRVHRFGVLVEGGEATFEDLEITDVRPDFAEDERGQGLYGVDGADVTATRVKVERAREAGIRARSTEAPGVVMRLTDVTVVDTSTNGDSVVANRGTGLHVDGVETVVTVLRGDFDGNRQANIRVFGGFVELRHVRAANGVPHRMPIGDSAIDFGGMGLYAEGDATINVGRFLAEDNRDAAILVRNANETSNVELTLTDAILRRTTVAGDALSLNMFGSGLVVGPGTTTRVERFWFEDNFSAGVRYAGLIGLPAPTLDLDDGLISDNGVGLLVQIPGYDVRRAMVRVVFRDNAATLLDEFD